MPYKPTIPAMQHWMVETYGDRTQIESPDEAASFADIERQSKLLARALVAQGLGKGAQIGLMLPNSPAWVATYLAIVRIGATAVLMSTLSKAPEILHMLRHGDIDTLITADTYLRNDYIQRLETSLPSLKAQDGARPLRAPEAPYLRAVWVFGAARPRWARGGREDLQELAAQVSPDFLEAMEAEVTPADRAIIMYSSGTTAAPKAIMHTHGVVSRHSWRMQKYYTHQPGDRHMTATPLFWVGGLLTSLAVANLRGAAFICPISPSVDDLLMTMRTRNVTHVSMWAHQMQAVMAHPDFRPDDLKRLKPVSSMQWSLFGLCTFDRMPNSLGMSESFGPHSGELAGFILPQGCDRSFGRRIGDADRIFVDAEGKRLPPNVEGELLVRGSQMMMGFYKKEREEVFTPDGYYRTGDYGWLDENDFLFFSGRRNEMIKTSGANVAPREVELPLGAMPEVVEAAVFAVPDDVVGEAVIAAVILREGAHVTEADLRARLMEQLSSFKVPKRIFFVQESEVVRTPSAKIVKERLKEFLAPRLKG